MVTPCRAGSAVTGSCAASTADPDDPPRSCSANNRRSADRRPPGDRPTVGDRETVGRRGRPGQETTAVNIFETARNRWENREISRSDDCTMNSFGASSDGSISEKPRKSCPKPFVHLGVTSEEDVHGSGLETLAERNSRAAGVWRRPGDPRRTKRRTAGLGDVQETLTERSNRTVVTSGEWQVKTEWPVASGGWRVKPKGGR